MTPMPTPGTWPRRHRGGAGRRRHTRTPSSRPTSPSVSTWPDLAAFRALAPDRRVIPVVRRLLADGETPVGVYRKLAARRGPAPSCSSRPSTAALVALLFVGARSHATLTERDGQAHWLGEPPVGVPTDGDPLRPCATPSRRCRPPRLPGLPPLTGGLVGYLVYDVVRRLERLPDTRSTTSSCPSWR